MKHFNLEEYLQNPSRKVVTRDGRNARIICTDAKALYPIIALIESPNHVDEIARSYAKDGYFCPGEEDVCDLFFASEKHEGWLNVYKDGDHFYSSMDILKTKEKAETLSCRSCIATVKIEWEE